MVSDTFYTLSGRRRSQAPPPPVALRPRSAQPERVGEASTDVQREDQTRPLLQGASCPRTANGNATIRYLEDGHSVTGAGIAC